jgi:DNA polymerase III subunit beta
LIEGQFLDYERIIPPGAKTKVKVSTMDFLRATRAAAVFARDNSMIVRLACSPAKDGAELALGPVLVKSTSAEMGDNEGNLDATIDGDDTQLRGLRRQHQRRQRRRPHQQRHWRRRGQMSSEVKLCLTCV